MVPSIFPEKADTPPINHRGNAPFCVFSGDLQTVMITWARQGALTSWVDGIHFPLGRLVFALPCSPPVSGVPATAASLSTGTNRAGLSSQELGEGEL